MADLALHVRHLRVRAVDVEADARASRAVVRAPQPALHQAERVVAGQEAGNQHDRLPLARRHPAGLPLTALMLGIGLLLTHALDGTVGKWDLHVNEHFARHRTSSENGVTSVATSGVNTLPVVIVAAVVVGFLSLLRRWREAAFLTIALFLEITVFLSVTFVVDRPRPPVASWS